MALTKVDLYNNILEHLGETPNVESSTEKTKAVKVFNAIYDVSRKTVLKAHDWGFAKRFYSLVAVGTAPVSWGYQYKHPNDMLKPRFIERSNRRSTELSYAIANYEDDDNGKIKVIHTDAGNAVMVGTDDIEDLSLFSEECFEALAAYMAFKSVRNFTDSRALKSDAWQVYQAMLAQGAQIDALSEADDLEQDADWIRARGSHDIRPAVIGE